MELTLVTYLIVCPLVFLAGLIDSVAGGGGLISLPAYYLAGLNPVLAAGTNKLSACLGTVASTTRFVRGKKVDWKAGIFAAIGAFPGSWLGTLLLQHIPEDTCGGHVCRPDHRDRHGERNFLQSSSSLHLGAAVRYAPAGREG